MRVTLRMRVRISPETRAYVRFLRIEGRKTVREVAKICSISPASVVRIIRKPVVGGGERSRAECS